MKWVYSCKSDIENLINVLKNYDNTHGEYDKFFNCFCIAFGVDDKLPNILNKKDYKEVDGLVLCRAYDSSFKDFALYENDFLNGKYQRYSRSVLGNGMCFTDDKKIIREYSSLKGKLFGANIIKCKIDNRAKLIKRSKLKEEFKLKYKELLVKVKDYLNCDLDIAKKMLKIASGEDNHMIRAILCGYDGICEQYDTGEKIFVIYNRSCLNVISKKNIINR